MGLAQAQSTIFKGNWGKRRKEKVVIEPGWERL